jgi:hypothetical protein
MRRRNACRQCRAWVCHHQSNPGTNRGHGMEQIYNIGMVGRRVEYWLYAGGLSGGEKQIGRIRNLEGASGGHIRVDWRSRGRDTGRKCRVGGYGRWSVECQVLRLIGSYENEGRGAGVCCRCVEVRMRPTQAFSTVSKLDSVKAVTNPTRLRP